MNIDFTFLYDTASEITVIREHEFLQLVASSGFTPETVHSAKSNLHGAFNNSAIAATVTLLPIIYNNQRVLFPVTIVKNLSSPGIMGIDLIDTLGINFLTTARNERPITALTIHSATIQPNETMTIEASVTDKERINDKKTVIIEGMDHSSIFITPALYTLSPTRTTVPLKIANTSAQAISLVSNQHIAKVTILPEDQKFVPFTQREAKRICTVHQPRIEKPDDKKMAAIKANFNAPTLPKQQQKQLLDLILRNADVFSNDKYDLGRTSTHTHDVDLKEDTVVFKKQFRVPQAHVEHIQTHVKKLLELGVIQRSNSKFNSPVPQTPGEAVNTAYQDVEQTSIINAGVRFHYPVQTRENKRGQRLYVKERGYSTSTTRGHSLRDIIEAIGMGAGNNASLTDGRPGIECVVSIHTTQNNPTETVRQI
ncbi:Hypothetical predicted protein, partial [Paramuricea clavata]